MEFHSSLYCVLLILLGLVSYSHAYVFYVGGRNGWVLNPSEGYNHWAERNRFLINDTIVFKYKKGTDSVLVVNKDDYENCNTKNPIKKFEDGNTIFKFDRSGPFYFIGGDGNCQKGQKLIVVVLAVRSSPVSPAPASPPKSPSPPPASSPKSPSPAPSSPSPKSPSPAPAESPKSPSPANAPAPAKPSPTPSPSATSPSPATESPKASPPAPPANTPSPAPSSTTPGSSDTPSQSPASQNEKAPAPSPNGARVVGPPSLLVYSVTIMIAAAVSAF